MRALALLILAASPAYAQQQCDTRDKVISLLKDKYGETRQAVGLAGPSAMMEMFASDASGTWTITMTLPDGRMCLVASGTSFESVTEPAGEDS